MAWIFLFLILSRRWYLFAVFGLLTSFGAISLYYFLFSKKKKTAQAQIIDFVKAGSIFLLLFLAIWPLARKIILNNYADMYSAYQRGSFFEHIEALTGFVGFLPLFFYFFMIFYIKKLNTSRSFWMALFLMPFLIFLLLTRTQRFDSHHYYLLLPSFLLLMGGLFVIFVSWQKKMVSFLLALQIMVLMYSFVPQKSFASIFHFFSGYPIYPEKRTDLAELHLLVNQLNQYSQKIEPIYILASSSILNEALLQNIQAPKTFRALPSALHVHHVDKRDGFPLTFLQAQWVLVTDPIQYHLAAEDQKVIGVLAEEILTEKGIGKAFEKEKTIDFQNMKVFIYKKIKDFETQDLQDLEKKFQDIYPAYAEKFKIL